MNLDPKKVCDQFVALVEKLNLIGASVEIGVKAFRDRLFPQDGVSGPELPADVQLAVDDAVVGCMGD
jgi:hypothetical protein